MSRGERRGAKRQRPRIPVRNRQRRGDRFDRSISLRATFSVPNGRLRTVSIFMGTTEATGDRADGVRRAGDSTAAADRADWGAFLSSHRDRLRRMVALRLDDRLRGRIDPSDVIQEAFLEATERRPEYVLQSDPMPSFLWLRFLTLQRLQLIHRRQLGTRAQTRAARCRSTAAHFRRRPRRRWRRSSWATTRGERSGHPRRGKTATSRGARSHGPDRSGSARLAAL